MAEWRAGRSTDAQRRSEATPKNDLSEEVDVWTTVRSRVLREIAAECERMGCPRPHPELEIDHPLDASRVDPYDTTKGGITE